MAKRKKKRSGALRSAADRATAGARKVAGSRKHSPPMDASSAQALGEDSSDRPLSDPKRLPRLSDPFDRYFFSAVAPSRPYLLLRLLLVVLAFDCWVDLIPHAGRYGVGAFNVAHFALLDLLPTPTPGLYIGLMLLTGWLALVMAIRPARAGLGVLFGLYTYGWSMSMLDSYQHHYLISLLLFSCIFFPTPDATEVFGPAREDRDPDLGRWRLVGGGLLLVALVETTVSTAGVRTPLTDVVSNPTARVGLRAAMALLGVLLLLLVDEGPRVRGKRGSAWAYVSFCVTAGLVYLYTAVTKLEPDWRQGHALRRLGSSDSFQELQARATGEGLPLLGPMAADDFWALMAAGAIAVQLVAGIGYVLGAKQDSVVGWRRYLVAALGLGPLSFHIGTERMQLEIGWFSYYMLLILFVVFLPIELLRPMGAAFTWPSRFIVERHGARFTDDRIAWAFLALGTAAAVMVALSLDLPGDAAAGFGMGVLLVGGGMWAMRRGRWAEARGWGLAAAVAAVAMGVAVTETDVRYDYYRFVGGDHRRRGEVEEALDAYVKANMYVVHPWCIQSGQERGECYRREERARDAAAAAGAEWRVVPNDRKDKEAEMRDRFERQRAAEGAGAQRSG